MRTTTNHIHGSALIHFDVFSDERGSFQESYNSKKFEELGLPSEFLQDNLSKSKAGALRGLHIQSNNPQGKLIRVLQGTILDVVVDLRPNSPSFKKWLMIQLDEHSKKALYVPEGCAHGFYSVTDSVVHYKCTTLYDKDSDGGIFPLDPALNINWPEKSPIISGKDMRLPMMEQYLRSRYGTK